MASLFGRTPIRLDLLTIHFSIRSPSRRGCKSRQQSKTLGSETFDPKTFGSETFDSEKFDSELGRTVYSELDLRDG